MLRFFFIVVYISSDNKHEKKHSAKTVQKTYSYEFGFNDAIIQADTTYGEIYDYYPTR